MTVTSKDNQLDHKSDDRFQNLLDFIFENE